MLCVCFLYKRKLSSFSLVTFGFVIFWHQNICKKTRKMLMKLKVKAFSTTRKLKNTLRYSHKLKGPLSLNIITVNVISHLMLMSMLSFLIQTKQISLSGLIFMYQFKKLSSAVYSMKITLDVVILFSIERFVRNLELK